MSNIVNLNLGITSITSKSGLDSDIGQNWIPNSNNFTASNWGCDTGVTLTLDPTIKDPFGGTQSVWKIVAPAILKGCVGILSTPLVTGVPIAGSTWVYTTGGLQLCSNAANVNSNNNSCITPVANTWTRMLITNTGGPNPLANTKGNYVYSPSGSGTWWEYNPVLEAGKQTSASQLINNTNSSITTDIPVNQIPTLEVLKNLQVEDLNDGCLQAASHVVTSTGTPCGSGGGGMTWPAGGAGIPNYNGASGWGASYNAGNPIPASFISTLNQNTSGTAGNLSGTPALPNGTTATTQAAADNSTKLATTAYADRAAGLGVTGGSVTIAGGTLAGTTCSGTATATDTGITTSGAYSRVIVSYTGDPSALVGWGSTGGMEFKAWPTASNTITYRICNVTASPITYSSITFGLGAN